jgi:hypothetical protein
VYIVKLNHRGTVDRYTNKEVLNKSVSNRQVMHTKSCNPDAGSGADVRATEERKLVKIYIHITGFYRYGSNSARPESEVALQDVFTGLRYRERDRVDDGLSITSDSQQR